MTKLVYLDSSDFSKLSAPEAELSPENRTILAMLREHKHAGTATFFMSAIHLCEAVHAAAEHKEAAVRRAELMRELCGSNILRLPTDLPKLELKRATAGEAVVRLTIDDIRSAHGEWFGVFLPLDRMPDNRANVRRQLNMALDSLPRRERRKRRSELDFQKPSSKEKWRELLKSGARTAPVPYPYNLVNQDVAIGWLLGEVSSAEFRKRTVEIMHDPYIMFKYLIDQTDHGEILYDSIRKQGREIAAWMEDHDQELIGALIPFAKAAVTPDLKTEVDKFFTLPSTLRKIISSHGFDTHHIPDADLHKIVRSCPSLFLFTELYRSILLSRANAYFNRISGGNISVKPTSSSDFADTMHCYYAAYFDVFRCDARFGALLKEHKPVRARIADRIGDIARMLATKDHRDVA